MKKAVLALFLSIILNSTATFAFYQDVPSDHLYYSEIKELYDLNRLPQESNFEPEALVNKIDLFKFILNYAKVDPQGENPDYLQAAVDLNLISNKSSFLENTETSVKKHTALNTLFTELGVGVNPLFDKNKYIFTDLGATSPISPTAQKALELGIVEKNDNKLFRPFKNITHGELAYYLDKIYKYEETKPETIVVKTTTSNGKITNKPDILLDVWDTIKKEHLDKNKLDYDAMEYKGIQGLLSEVSDPYTTYQKADDANNFLDTLANEVEGIGAMMDYIDDQVVVVSPIKNSPAESAGLLPGDIITAVDGKSVIGEPLATVASKIKGPSGTTVTITVKRDKSTKTFVITRAKIAVNSVESELMTSPSGKKIAYILIYNFGEKTAAEFKTAAENLITQNPDGFIIDLRNNPGGYVNAAGVITGYFLDKSQTVVTFKNASGTENDIPATATGLLSKYQIVILMNKGSASASEIFAGALQDLKIAKIVGSQSFGKGTAQALKNYKDGSLFKYTIAQWLTPNGNAIQGKGITPDIKVENSDTKDKQLESALIQFK